MADLRKAYGYLDRQTDRQIAATQRKIERIYREAQRDLKTKLRDFATKHKAADQKKRALRDAGKITEADYQSWLRGQVFIENQFKDKLDQTVRMIESANEQAIALVNGDKMHVFAENYNFSAYQLEKQAHGAISFNLYSEDAVSKLIKEKPKMLPEWKIDKKKDYRWSRQKVENAITQGIVQGESIDDITDRLVESLCAQSENRMRTFARTAITGSQNAGRMQQMHDAEDLGVQVKKRWIATLDDRTRDTHRDLDGQTVPVDEPFEVDGMEIMYPGDPSAEPELVYNCRCTMIQVFEGIDRKSVRRDDEGNMVEDMNYREWEEWKKREGSP